MVFSSPIYETDKNRDDERKIFEQAEKYWPNIDFGCSLGTTCFIDRVGRDRRTNRVVVVAEARNRETSAGRPINMRSHDTFIINKSKVLRGIDRGLEYGVPYIIIASWADLMGYTRIASLNPSWAIDFGRRFDRGDPNDNQKVVHVPVDLFKVMGPSIKIVYSESRKQ